MEKHVGESNETQPNASQRSKALSKALICYISQLTSTVVSFPIPPHPPLMRLQFAQTNALGRPHENYIFFSANSSSSLDSNGELNTPRHPPTKRVKRKHIPHKSTHAHTETKATPAMTIVTRH